MTDTERLFDGISAWVDYDTRTDRAIIGPDETFREQTEVVAGSKKFNYIVEKETGTILNVEILNFRNFLLDALGLSVA